jgi:hypothetical protein
MRYDADRQPDAQSWLALDEAERIDIVVDYHRRTRVKLENAKVHAVAHVIVENQIALGAPPMVSATFARLMDEGLDRHDAIHAVGSIVMGVVYDILREPGANRNANEQQVNEQYNRRLATLTAASWRAQADPDD